MHIKDLIKKGTSGEFYIAPHQPYVIKSDNGDVCVMCSKHIVQSESDALLMIHYKEQFFKLQEALKELFVCTESLIHNLQSGHNIPKRILDLENAQFNAKKIIEESNEVDVPDELLKE